jgi:hypothetical protein
MNIIRRERYRVCQSMGFGAGCGWQQCLECFGFARSVGYILIRPFIHQVSVCNSKEQQCRKGPVRPSQLPTGREGR